jgi:hypothetical protein
MDAALLCYLLVLLVVPLCLFVGAASKNRTASAISATLALCAALGLVLSGATRGPSHGEGAAALAGLAADGASIYVVVLLTAAGLGVCVRRFRNGRARRRNRALGPRQRPEQ